MSQTPVLSTPAPASAADADFPPVLGEALLARIAARAAGYDRENRFFDEDLEDLRAAGYLKLWVPKALGGLGYGLPQVLREQGRLAYHAPATALAINMHLYWSGTAAYLHQRGDPSTDWILDEIVAGRIFAAGHGEPNNDLGLAGSTVRAEPLEGGAYRFTGRKVFTSLAPVWDWLGVHGLDDSDPERPRIVHAFIRRTDPGHRTEPTWDALGVRATRSDDTVLEDAVAQVPYVSRVLPAGPPDDPFVDGIFGAAILPIAAVYHGIARRAFDLAIESARKRSSAVLGGRRYAHHPIAQLNVSRAAIELDTIEALLERTAQDWAAGADHGALWPAKLLAAKQHAVDGARRVVDLATDVVGASSLLRRNELERLVRDVRSGPFHPPNTVASHDVIGKSYLGVLGEPA